MKKKINKKNNLVKKIVGAGVIVLVTSTLFGLVCSNSKYIFTREKYYSQTELNQKYEEGYNKGAYDNRDENIYAMMDKLSLENSQIKQENEELKNQNNDNLNKISDNQKIIESLNSEIEILQSSAEENSELIKNLVSRKNELENQNNIYTYQISQNNAIIEENNAKIEQLQNSLVYYENYIANQESETEVFAIFRVENEIIDIQKVNKNGLAYLENQPSDTERYTFNGWKVNGVSVDLSSYELNCNTTFVADLNYKSEVKFIVDVNEEDYNVQFVEKNSFASEPNVPKKDGYTFIGWSRDGVNVEEISSVEIIEDTIFIALFKEKQIAGLFDDNNVMLMSWSDLIANNYLSVSDGVLNLGSKVKDIVGNLIISDEISSLRFTLFEECSGLTSVVIPDSVQSIGFRAFLSCSNLKSVTIGTGVEEIGNLAFGLCRNLTEMNFNAINCADTTYNASIFAHCGLDTDGLTLRFGDEVKRIPAYLFSMNDASYNVKLTSVYISNSVTEIGSGAFYQCIYLKSIYIPSSVVNIGSNVFYNCSSDLTVYCEGSNFLSTWDSRWNYHNTFKYLAVKYGYTYNQYFVEIGG